MSENERFEELVTLLPHSVEVGFTAKGEVQLKSLKVRFNEDADAAAAADKARLFTEAILAGAREAVINDEQRFLAALKSQVDQIGAAT